MSINNGADHSKPKAGAFVSWLSREIRLEYLVVELVRDARAGVLDKTDDMSLVIREMSPDSQDSVGSAFHSIRGIEDKIDENLAQLVRVASNLRKLLIEHRHKSELSLRIVAFKPLDASGRFPQ